MGRIKKLISVGILGIIPNANVFPNIFLIEANELCQLAILSLLVSKYFFIHPIKKHYPNFINGYCY